MDGTGPSRDRTRRVKDHGRSLVLTQVHTYLFKIVGTIFYGPPPSCSSEFSLSWLPRMGILRK